MSGTLFVVATPIGNLEDITLRALRVLRDADLIAAEDTRRTARLLAHHGIPTRTVSFHAHNIRSRLPQLLRRLGAGERIALVTDAGTPGISDPGVELVQACHANRVAVDPIPGVSAPLTAAIASGFPLVPLTILGFAPSRSKDRKPWLSALNRIGHTATFFETPHRIRATLQEMALELGDRPIVIGRELTKAHQQFLSGTAEAVLEQLGEPRGEFTVVVGPPDNSLQQLDIPSDDATMAAEFGRMTESGALGRREAITAVAKKYQRPAREVYAAVERAKN